MRADTTFWHPCVLGIWMPSTAMLTLRTRDGCPSPPPSASPAGKRQQRILHQMQPEFLAIVSLEPSSRQWARSGDLQLVKTTPWCVRAVGVSMHVFQTTFATQHAPCRQRLGLAGAQQQQFSLAGHSSPRGGENAAGKQPQQATLDCEDGARPGNRSPSPARAAARSTQYPANLPRRLQA
jgi:hypothetical protein